MSRGMMKSLHIVIVLAWAMLVAAAGMAAAGSSVAAGPAAAASLCFEDWSQAAAIVKRHKLVPVAVLGTLARRQRNSQLVRTELCRGENGFVYKIVLRDKRGALKRMIVSAKHPFAPAGPTK